MSKEKTEKMEPSAELRSLLGEATTAKNPNKDIFQSALIKVRKEKADALENVAIEKIRDAIKIQEEIDKIEGEYKKTLAGAKKRLSNVIGAIKRMAQDKSAKEKKNDGEDAGQEDAGQEDAGQEDAGQEDAGQEDAGQEDASPENQ